MRKILTALTAIISLLFLLSSCSTGKATLDQRKSDLQQSKETFQECFVLFTDGSTQQYQSLQLQTGVLKAPYLLANGKIKIKPAAIKAYQNNDHYAISQAAFNFGTPTTYVAVETLPGFAVRIAKGKLNIYCKKFYNGNNAADQFFLQQGDGTIAPYSATAMKSIVKDNLEAMAFFTEQKTNTGLGKILKTTADIYNNAQLISKN